MTAVKSEDTNVQVKLLKNYVPMSTKFDIIGWTKPAKKTKTVSGTWIEVEPEEWREGEIHPPLTPGAQVEGKIWAGTTVALPVEEARRAIKLKIAERALDF